MHAWDLLVAPPDVSGYIVREGTDYMNVTGGSDEKLLKASV